MPTTQFNVRIDEIEKNVGDEAFASIDYSPSQVVQEVWGYAARNRQNKRALRKLVSLVNQQEESKLSEHEERLKWHESASHLYTDMLKEMGIESLPEPLDMTDDELLYQAYLDKMEERGMSI